jgi:hypothetical protein
LGIFSELGQILEGFQQGFLDRVLGIFPVARDSLRDSKKSAIVSLYELLEGGNIPLLAGVDKLQVIAGCELYRVSVHSSLPRFGERPFAAEPTWLPAGGRLLAHRLEV